MLFRSASFIADSEYDETTGPQPGNSLLRKAKKLFVASNYERSAELLEEFIRSNPDNPNMPQAFYLLEESYYHNDQTEAAIREINSLIAQYPETHFAALSMDRLGTIFTSQERVDEATEIYQTVIDHFPDSVAAGVAKDQLMRLKQ